MKTVRDQARAMGHPPAGPLIRGEDDIFHRNGEEFRYRIYFDSEGTEYAVNWKGDLVYIVGENFVI